MTYQTTITKKGQLTIPKGIRDALGILALQKMVIRFEKKEREIRIKPIQDFFQSARQIKVKKKRNPLEARKYLENNYVRS
ncbi:MAG: AbrB/MazE/SpoVT family DNA-binding domain-containing protein [bacterium]